jgi:hypothetical protein
MALYSRLIITNLPLIVNQFSPANLYYVKVQEKKQGEKKLSLKNVSLKDVVNRFLAS